MIGGGWSNMGILLAILFQLFDIAYDDNEEVEIECHNVSCSIICIRLFIKVKIAIFTKNTWTGLYIGNNNAKVDCTNYRISIRRK